MKKTVILSLITATVLTTVCSAEEKSILDILHTAIADMKKVVNEKTVTSVEVTKVTVKGEEKTTSQVSEQKINSIGEGKAIGEIISEAGKTTSSTDKKNVSEKKVEPSIASTSEAFDYKLSPKKVAENVWCFLGALDKPTKENAGFMANSCYVKTSEGYFLMDSGPSYQFAKQAYDVMKKIANLPVKYVVNSHHHDDHWLGNDFYKKTFNAKLIGPESINSNYKEGDKTRMYKVLPANAIEGTHIIKLDVVPKKEMVVTLGGEEFHIIPMDVKAHTSDDVFVYMPKSKVLFGGDLVMNGRVNSDRDGAVMGELKAIKMMRGMEWNTLVPGHGLITDKTALDETELYFTLMKKRVLEAMEDDVDATGITDRVKLEEFKDKAMYDLLNARNVGYAFDELEMLDDE
jgi:glyoxylase-like metal-dependent hydrolase (beta-lactamase superfamily II)